MLYYQVLTKILYILDLKCLVSILCRNTAAVCCQPVIVVSIICRNTAAICCQPVTVVIICRDKAAVCCQPVTGVLFLYERYLAVLLTVPTRLRRLMNSFCWLVLCAVVWTLQETGPYLGKAG
jgi:hypothetical protein